MRCTANRRVQGPFVALNTAAIPAELLESELFGHEGRLHRCAAPHIGRFEQANGGTLFLDEIGDMPLPLQTRLLRVLAQGEFFRVGGRELIRVDVRVVAATHQDLEGLVAQAVPRRSAASPGRGAPAAAAAA
jgi:two-component system nitrogen regulation response regulator GlnG